MQLHSGPGAETSLANAPAFDLPALPKALVPRSEESLSIPRLQGNPRVLMIALRIQDNAAFVLKQLPVRPTLSEAVTAALLE